MKKSRIHNATALVAAVILSSLLLACSESQAPLAVGYIPGYQPKIQAVEHWRAIADDVANRVLLALQDRPDLREKHIFLASPNNRPFSVAFFHLLRSELVSRGLQLSYNREPQSVVMEYAVQSVLFDNSRFGTAMDSFGNSQGESGISPSNNELIVNVRMFYQNRFVIHASVVRYINDIDLPMYLDPQIADPMAESTRNIRVINR
jgi:hypothetical protein